MTGATAASIPIHPVELGPGVGAWFTGRARTADEPEVGRAGNLSHRQPHEPLRLAQNREAVCDRIGVEVEDLHHMRQVHGSEVGTVEPDTVRGAELRDVDALVTASPGRALVVQVADCIPMLLASSAGPVAAVHAGRRGLGAGVVEACVDRLEELGAPAASLSAVIGPAIGGCCYEVPEELRDEFASGHPVAAAETTYGTPSLDLPAAARAALQGRGVERVEMFGSCTYCDGEGRWFSYRRDREAGRQVGIVVRRNGA